MKNQSNVCCGFCEGYDVEENRHWCSSPMCKCHTSNQDTSLSKEQELTVDEVVADFKKKFPMSKDDILTSQSALNYDSIKPQAMHGELIRWLRVTLQQFEKQCIEKALEDEKRTFEFARKLGVIDGRREGAIAALAEVEEMVEKMYRVGRSIITLEEMDPFLISLKEKYTKDLPNK